MAILPWLNLVKPWLNLVTFTGDLTSHPLCHMWHILSTIPYIILVVVVFMVLLFIINNSRLQAKTHLLQVQPNLNM